MGRAAWIRILPFAVFMGFIALQQGLEWLADKDVIAVSEAGLLYLYPLKAVVVAILLAVFWKRYDELDFADLRRAGQTLTSCGVGLVVFVLWINMDWEFATFGQNKGFDPYLDSVAGSRDVLIAFRLFGAVLVVPIMEELFWRSFLLRYIIDSDFTRVRIGTYTLGSFLIGSVLFGLEHHLVLAGVMAGLVYALLLYRTRSIAQCVLAHAVTNLALGIYVLLTGSWLFW